MFEVRKEVRRVITISPPLNRLRAARAQRTETRTRRARPRARPQVRIIRTGEKFVLLELDRIRL